jgi:hypothetical protein
MDNATAEPTRAPLIKELSDDGLREHYRGLRALAYNNAQMAQTGAVNTRKLAAQMGKLMKWIEICEAVARKRGIRLVVPAAAA